MQDFTKPVITTSASRPKAPADAVAEFAELPRLIREQGLLDRQLRYYTLKMASTLALLMLSIALLIVVDNFWFQIANAVFLAFVFGQIGYIGHDAGHLGVCRSVRGNRLIGYGVCLLLGMSQSWWLTQHNQHHRSPNDLDDDPHTLIPLLAYSEEKASDMRGVVRFLAAYQAFYFIPMLTFESLALRFSSAQFLVGARRPGAFLPELGLMAAHFALYAGLLLYALNPWQALVFALVHQGLFGLYYGLVFAPNHKGMLILDKDNPLDFVRTQVLTTRNVKPNFLVDFLYGGLNYQIEHHLFTMMPRNRLGKARPIVKEFCRQRGIPYHETGTLTSYREILSHMHEVSAVLRKGPKPPVEIENGNPPTAKSGIGATG